MIEIVTMSSHTLMRFIEDCSQGFLEIEIYKDSKMVTSIKVPLSHLCTEMMNFVGENMNIAVNSHALGALLSEYMRVSKE